MAKLILKDVNKIYTGGCRAVDSLSLEIEEGEFVCLVGGQGSGKTTVLKMLAGTEETTSGELFIDGRLANGLTPRERGVAIVLQSYALYPYLTVQENLAFGLDLEGADAEETDKKVKAVAAKLALSDVLGKFPRNVPAAVCRRAAVARAVVRGASVFLMDEPLSATGRGARSAAAAEIRQIHDAVGATTLYAADNAEEAALLADRIVYLKGGRIDGQERIKRR